MVLHGLITAIYAAVVGDTAEGGSGRAGAGAGGAGAGARGMPVLALIWGVRATELLEIWARFREGFTLGETRIAPGNILSFLLVFASATC
jgi:potassium-dependent mechanosensitive channel